MGEPGAPAIITAHGNITHSQLEERISATADLLRGPRRLALVRALNDLGTVVDYLGAMKAGHPVLLVPAADDALHATLEERFRPGLIRTPDSDWRITDVPTTDLHPDLALLLTTSGTTGSPKLVRLSHENLRSNAASIVDFLGIESTDRALATLPLHYSYGLSVLHSHLLAGAAVVLTDAGVVDPCCWELADRSGVTSFAGVPHTFTLLDRGDPKAVLPRTLRTITQAGGRMDPEAVRRWADLGRRRSFDFVVMYGQTEATARMAWLPPTMTAERPGAIGVPIPGGAFRLADTDTAPTGAPDTVVGELVYSGPNVMLGYADSPQDLTLGRTVQELYTGDLARRADDGLWEIVGRTGRFAKPFGLRVDLDHLESVLSRQGVDATCVAVAESIGVAVEDAGNIPAATSLITEQTGLPRSSVRVVCLHELPLTASGKVDLTAVAAIIDGNPLVDEALVADGVPTVGGTRVIDVYRRHFPSRSVGPTATFVDLGGDSLSYVEFSMDLEIAIGHLPTDWHLRSVEDLAATTRAPRRLARVEVGAVLRALGILLVVGRHVDLLVIGGGAHVLMALSGQNFSRFPLTAAQRDQRWTRLFSAAANVAVPTALWLAVVVALGGGYSWWNVAFANSFTGPARWGDTWRYWYVEALVQILVVAAVLFSVPAVRRLNRRLPFALPLALTLASLTLRFRVIEYGPEFRQVNLATGVVWLFLLGWAAHRAASTTQRLMVSAVAAVAVPGWFGDPGREVVVALALLAIIWVREVPLPRFLAPAVGAIGSASLWIYLTHWQVYPALAEHLPPAALVVASVAVGVLAWRIWEQVLCVYGAATQRRTRRDPTEVRSSNRPEARAGR